MDLPPALLPFRASPLFPLLLFSLTTERHAPVTKDIFRSDYDYIIVGAGSAGSVLANRLSELFCSSVLLLEAGDSPPILTEVPGFSGVFERGNITWDYFSTPQEHTAAAFTDQKVPLPAGKVIGGSSVINAMLYSRGNPLNYEVWESLGAKGWNYNKVLPYFKKLENNQDLEYLLNGYHGTSGPITTAKPNYQSETQLPIMVAAKQAGYNFVDINGPKQHGFYDHQATIRNGRRCSTAKAYLLPSEHRLNLDILSGAFVTKVIIDGRRATGVKFDFRGTSYVVNARSEVILSAGAINSAKLLMLSGIGPKAHLKEMQIPVVADLPVGLNLQDHYGNFAAFELDKAIPPISAKLTNSTNILDYIQKKTGPLTSTWALSSMAYLSNKNPLNPNSVPDHGLYFLEVDASFAKTRGISDLIYELGFKQYENKTLMACIFLTVHSKSRGWVRLQSSDPYDAPLINPNYFADERDVADVVQGLIKCLDLMSNPVLSELGVKPLEIIFPGCENFKNLEELLRCSIKYVVVTSSHFAGTAKMGRPSDLTTVLDPQLRVKTIDNLRVVDASIMPTIVWGHTNVPTIMIAEKAADMIKESVPPANVSCFQNSS